MQFQIFVAVLFLGSVLATRVRYTRNMHLYRADYTYYHPTRSYFKVHTFAETYDRAKRICIMEGAQLMEASDFKTKRFEFQAEMARFIHVPAIVWVGNKSYDDPLHGSCLVVGPYYVINKLNCPGVQPFVCKVEANAVFDELCGVYGSDYTYIEPLRNCYRVPNLMLNWEQAYHECFAELANLAWLESVKEAVLVKELIIKKAPITDNYYYAGFRADPAETPTVFKTIFNQTLEEAGFSQWSYGEPDNYFGSEYCGVIGAHSGKYYDMNCLIPFPFICKTSALYVP